MNDAKVKELIANLENENAAIRRGAAYSLGQMGSDATPAVEALCKALKDPDDDVRAAAASAIGEIGPAAKSAIPDLIKAFMLPEGDGQPIAEALASFGKDALPYLKKCLHFDDPNVRFYAITTLSVMGKEAEELLPDLRKLLEDEDEGVRFEVTVAIEAISDEPLEEYKKALDSGDWKARRGAAEAIGNMGKSATDSVSDLKKYLEDENESVRMASQAAIKKINMAETPPVLSEEDQQMM